MSYRAVLALGLTVGLLLAPGGPIPAAPARASAAADASSNPPRLDFCWNYALADCPDPVEFYWKPSAPLSKTMPPEFENWVSVVAPEKTFFFFQQLPKGKRGSGTVIVAWWEWEWTVVPGSWFDFGDHHGFLGQVFDKNLPSTLHAYDRSSYGQSLLNPRLEPGYKVNSKLVWMGWFKSWVIVCKPFPVCTPQQMPPLPMVAWESRDHTVAVRQILPMDLGY